MFVCFFNRVSQHLPPVPGNIIVYGNTIDTYTTVETLLNVGVRGSYIHLVQPPPTSTVTCINNYSVESAVEDALRAVGVTIHRDALLAQWNDGRYPDPIQSACFTTPTKPFRLTCCVSQSPGASLPLVESNHLLPAHLPCSPPRGLRV